MAFAGYSAFLRHLQLVSKYVRKGDGNKQNEMHFSVLRTILLRTPAKTKCFCVSAMITSPPISTSQKQRGSSSPCRWNESSISTQRALARTRGYSKFIAAAIYFLHGMEIWLFWEHLLDKYIRKLTKNE